MCQFDSVVSLSVELDNQAFDLFRNLFSGVVLSLDEPHNTKHWCMEDFKLLTSVIHKR